MNVLCIGDIVGHPGRHILGTHLSRLQADLDIDFTIANVENAAAGFGITEKIYDELCRLPIQAFTSGNHIWDKKEIIEKFNSFDRLLRPHNFAPAAPGIGWRIFHGSGVSIGVVNLIGRVFMGAADCPFRCIQGVLEKLSSGVQLIFVDFHAETTSEKQAMGYFLDGRVSAMFGTHTHVMTADNRILPEGSAYISDIGMTGAKNGVLGMDKEAVLHRFLTGLPAKFEPPKSGMGMLNAIKVTCDPKEGSVKAIERIQRDYPLGSLRG